MKQTKFGTAKRMEWLLELCAENPDMPSKTLARMAYSKKPLEFTSLESCRSAVRNLRGNNGERHRKGSMTRSMHRPNQPAGFNWHMPESQAKPWKPFALDAQRILVLSDIHLPFHDSKAIASIIKHGKTLSPDCILLNGDTVDFYAISRFESDPSKAHTVKEIECARQFLGWLRQEFPKARIIFKEGNHDERFAHYIWRKAPELWGIPHIRLQKLLTCSRIPDADDEFEAQPAIDGIEWVGDQRVIHAGALRILHGHEMGKATIAPPVNPARGAFLRLLECSLSGHLHKSSAHEETSLNGKVIACWTTGCLCDLRPEYARVNKWGQGGAFVEVNGDDFDVSIIRIREGKILSK